MASEKSAIIVISSHVVRGTVGNRAAAFALEVLGYPVWIVPTVTLPWHPGHGAAERIVPSKDDFKTLLENLGNAPWLGEVGAVLSGYLGSSDQVEAVAKLVKQVKSKNPNAHYTLDPVIGDAGRLYVPEDQATGIRDTLLPMADLTTPNTFELEWLTGTTGARTNEDLLEAARNLPCSNIVVTSAFAMMRGNIGNLLWSNGKASLAEHRSIDGPPNGLGDLTAALLTGHILAGATSSQALEKTCASVMEVMLSSNKRGSDELALESGIGSLLQPRASIEMRQLYIR